MHRSRMKTCSGFTLIELIAAMVIMGIFGSFFAHSFQIAGESYHGVIVRQELLRDGRIALERMTREIRVVATATGVDAVTLSSSEFSFRDRYGNTYTYSHVGDSVLRNGVALVDSVATFAFGYYRKNGSTTTNGNDLHLVVVTFTLSRGGESIPFRATITPPAFAPSNTCWTEK